MPKPHSTNAGIIAALVPDRKAKEGISGATRFKQGSPGIGHLLGNHIPRPRNSLYDAMVIGISFLHLEHIREV